MGFSQLLDELIGTGVEKQHIQTFLQANPQGKGSIMDQITAQLTNNLAEGIGVKQSDMTAQDVQNIRKNPTGQASQKPINE